MEVRRQIAFIFITCCCANIIYTEELDESSTSIPSEEFSNQNELKTGNLTGKITALKNGSKVEFKINTAVTWREKENIDSKLCDGVDKPKGDKGDKGLDGLPGPKGEKGEKGDNGLDGLPGPKGEKGEKGDNGLDGLLGPKGEKGENGTNGIDGPPGAKGDKGEKGDRGPEGYNGLPGVNGEKGEKGEKGVDGVSGAKGEKGEKGEKGDIGLPGLEGKKGEKGDKGADGLKGEKGEPGTCDESYGERRPDNYGSKDHPAYSCFDVADAGKYYVNRAKPFEIMCQDYESCIPNPSKYNFSFELRGVKKIWLSSLGFSLRKFYNLKISQLSYLMTTNDDFHLTLRYNNEVSSLKMFSWNGITMDIGFMSLWNGCKGTIKKKEKYTDLEVQCAHPNYLPMDFFVETTTENVFITLINLCFN